MTEFDAFKDFRFNVHDVKNKTYKRDGDLYVDKVVLKTDNHQIPKEKVTINPEVSETEIEKIKQDGTVYENETEKDRDPTILELDSKFPRIKQITSAVNNKGVIELKGLVRTAQDEGDDPNFFIRSNELDKLTARVPETEEEDAEKLEESSTAEEFVEDQTNIETGEEDEEEDTELKSAEDQEDEKVLFGGDEDE